MQHQAKTYHNTELCLVLYDRFSFLMVCRDSGVTKRLVLYWDETKIPAFCSVVENLRKLEKNCHKVKFHKFFSNEAEEFYCTTIKNNATWAISIKAKRSNLKLPVWGGCLSGRIKCWKFMIHTASAPNHLSDTARI